jgi:hypothetical protein
MALRLRFPLVSVFIAAAGAVALAITVSPVAQAAVSHDPGLRPPQARATATQTFTIPAGTTTFSSTAGGMHLSVTRAAASPDHIPPAMTCQVTAWTPYSGSNGSGEVVEGYAQLNCDETVYAIEVSMDLYLNGNVVATSTQTGYNVTAVAAWATYPLIAGTYDTWGSGFYYATSGSSASNVSPHGSPSVYLS